MKLFALSFFAIVLYIAAASLQMYRGATILNLTVTSFPSKPLLLLLGGLAMCLHALILYFNLVTPAGLNLGFFHAASLISWMIAVLLLLSLLRQPVENLVIVVFPLATLTIGLEGYIHSERILSSQTYGVTLHILFSIIAYSLLSISALQALFLAYQDYQLHHKHPGWVIQILPPLQVMEKLLFQMIALGFVLLSLGMISGMVFLEDIFAQHLVHKTVLSIVAWCVFGLVLWGHWRYGWRGRTAIGWNLSGFFILMLAYFGSKMVLELILHR